MIAKIDRLRGTRYAALNPSIRLLITLDAAQSERTNGDHKQSDRPLPAIAELLQHDIFGARRQNAGEERSTLRCT